MRKLSVITINRNNAEGLRKTMRSVFAQTYRDFEYIVVDGASTDNSVDVIKAYAQAEGLDFKWISEPDTGIYNAMNKGIEIAEGRRVVNSFNRSELVEDKNGEANRQAGAAAENKETEDSYVLMLNSGDFLIAQDVLESVFSQESDADIINARCNVSSNGKVIWTSPYLPKVTLKDLYFVGLPHQSTFVRKSLIEQYGLYREDFRYNSDIDFWYKTIILGDATIRGVNIVTTDYNLDGQSTKDAQTETYKNEMKEILSQGFLPKVLPDYDCWKKDRYILNKYSWIEKHTCLQRVLALVRKIYKHI